MTTTYAAGIDFMIDFNEWKNIQHGATPTSQVTTDPVPRFMRDGRALAAYIPSRRLGGIARSVIPAIVKSSPSLTLRRSMERPNGSFKQHCVNGPTLAPTTTQISDRLSCSIGSIATTGIGHMVA
jgi:hypothetical protein